MLRHVTFNSISKLRSRRERKKKRKQTKKRVNKHHMQLQGKRGEKLSEVLHT